MSSNLLHTNKSSKFLLSLTHKYSRWSVVILKLNMLEKQCKKKKNQTISWGPCNLFLIHVVLSAVDVCWFLMQCLQRDRRSKTSSLGSLHKIHSNSWSGIMMFSIIEAEIWKSLPVFLCWRSYATKGLSHLWVLLFWNDIWMYIAKIIKLKQSMEYF